MAVPFAFPEENNDVDVIIRQLSLLLNRLAVEFKKQRNENVQLRARNKLQSGSGRQTTHPNQEHPNGAVVSDTVLSAIATCKRFTVSHSVADPSTARDFEDAKNDAISPFDKNEFYEADENQELAEIEPVYVVDAPASFFRLRWETCRLWWSWFVPRNITTNQFWTTTVICVVGWHLLR
ncbi:uncharacterized protein LOC123321731 [Coccinella septempunctata]|uniref:uncharacterized protein LOC123321731 n=1 Tax=Coccinella septempunctata TaxID=41139 RepID=UPI001D08938F|nr:uncharacterized protein LOC123321731 [Coccinella septempunctata]